MNEQIHGDWGMQSRLDEAEATIGTLKLELEEARSQLTEAEAENEQLRQKTGEIFNFIAPLLAPRKKSYNYVLSGIEKILKGEKEE